MKKFLAKMQ